MTTDNVTYIRGGDLTPPGQPVEGIVKLCERLLADAREGKLRALAIAGLDGQGASIIDYEYDGVPCGELLGILMVAVHRISVQHDLPR